MKIRNGFVSNSSSSSFIILGVSNPRPDQLELFGALKADKKFRAAILYQDENGYAEEIGPGEEQATKDGDQLNPDEIVALGVILMEEEGGESKSMSLSQMTTVYYYLEQQMGILPEQVELIATTLDR